MREYEWQREAGDDDKGGDKATEIDGTGALAIVGRKVVTSAVCEECVWEGSENESQCCPNTAVLVWGRGGRWRCGWGREGGGKVDPPTRRGSQFDQSAQERIIIKNPTARTKESKMTAVDMIGCI